MSLNTQRVLRNISKGILFFVGLGLLGYVGYLTYLSVSFRPMKVRVSNVTESSFTVSWITGSPMKGVVYFKDSNSFLPGPLSWLGSERGYDDRDYASAQGSCVDDFNSSVEVSDDFVVDGSSFDCENIEIKEYGSYYTHHVTLKNLDSEKEYFFRVGDGVWSWNVEDERQKVREDEYPGVSEFVGKTFALRDSVSEPNPAFGYVVGVVNEDGEYKEDDSVDALVFSKLVSLDDSMESGLFSSVTNEEGGWYVDKSNGRQEDGSWYDYKVDDDFLYVGYQYRDYDGSKVMMLRLGIEDVPAPEIVGVTEEELESMDENESLLDKLKGVVSANDCRPNCATFADLMEARAGDDTSGSEGKAARQAQRYVASHDVEAEKAAAAASIQKCGINCTNPNVVGYKVAIENAIKTGETEVVESLVNTPGLSSLNPELYKQAGEYLNNKIVVKDRFEGDGGHWGIDEGSLDIIKSRFYKDEVSFAENNDNGDVQKDVDNLSDAEFEDPLIFRAYVFAETQMHSIKTNSSDGEWYLDWSKDEIIQNINEKIKPNLFDAKRISLTIDNGKNNESVFRLDWKKNEEGIKVLDSVTCEQQCMEFKNDNFDRNKSIEPAEFVDFLQKYNSDDDLVAQYLGESSSGDSGNTTKITLEPMFTSPPPSGQGVSVDVKGVSTVEENTENSIFFYLPEYGFYTLEMNGIKVEGQFETNNNIVNIFYVESNNIEGFQMPADVDNPQPNEDTVIKTDAFEIKYSKVANAQTLNLNKGINIISFDNILALKDNEPGGTAMELVLWAKQNGVDLQAITYFENGKWSGGVHCDGNTKTECSGMDFDLIPGRGYLLLSGDTSNLSIPIYTLQSPVPIALSTGWNLVGVHGYSKAYTARSLVDSINSISGLTADNISWWPTSKGKYEGIQVTDGKTYGLDFPISPRNGYFIRISKYSPPQPECQSIIWNENGNLNGTCGNSKSVF